MEELYLMKIHQATEATMKASEAFASTSKTLLGQIRAEAESTRKASESLASTSATLLGQIRDEAITSRNISKALASSSGRLECATWILLGVTVFLFIATVVQIVQTPHPATPAQQTTIKQSGPRAIPKASAAKLRVSVPRPTSSASSKRSETYETR